MARHDDSTAPSRLAELIGLPMPNDFPADLYNNINARLQQWWRNAPAGSPAASPLRDGWAEHFAGGWQGVAYRFLDCAGHDAAFTDSVRRAGPTPGDPVERYAQHHALFGFFVTGQAILENLYYSLYALGAALDAATFSFITQNRLARITMEEVATQFEAVFAKEDLSSRLRALVLTAGDETTPWGEWRSVRNALPHRMAPGQHTRLRIGGPDAGRTTSWWAQNLVLDEQTTATRRAWLASTLTDILMAAETFTQHHFA